MRIIYACDIGTTRQTRRSHPRFAWVRLDPSNRKEGKGSHDIELLAQYIVNDLNKGVSVALGFEAPLFIPIPTRAADLSTARAGEGNRSFAAPAGLTVAALCIHQTSWLFDRLRSQIPTGCQFTFDWNEWPPDPNKTILFVWEAFVSGPAHATTDMSDAATAAVEFCRNEGRLKDANAVTGDRVISLIGASALWSGVIHDVGFLKRVCLVIKPDTTIECNIASV